MTADARRIKEIAKANPPELDELEAVLEASHHQNRLAAIRTLSGAEQKRLYDAAEGRPAGLEYFVPPNAESMQEIVHHGQNTLPAFRSFQKRFCRPPHDELDETSVGDDADGEAAPYSDEIEADHLWGYNEQTFRLLTGPGYFTAYEDEDTGETWIDYNQLPENHPSGWPDIIPNESRLGRFVYSGTVDRMRALSEHVTIGRAFDEDDQPMDNWFILVREPR